MSEPILPPALPESLPADSTVGLTTTVPLEVVLAAGLTPVDLNNLFISAADPSALVADAEGAGFPRTCCCWTKGLYGAVRRLGIRRIIGVTQGDCSNTNALMEMLRFGGVECIPFEFPHRPDARRMRACIEALADVFGTTMADAEKQRAALAQARQTAADIDRLSWQEGKVHGLENHLWLVSTSDFCADPGRYERGAEQFLRQAGERPALRHELRLGFVGVPPIQPAIYAFLESVGGLIVYNETQRQFSLPAGGQSLAEAYTRYTYPYGIFARVEDIAAQCRERSLDGIIHYVQSFCFRRIEDRILRASVPVPVLTVECDLPGELSGQLRTRLEAFVQMLGARKRGRTIF